MPPKKTNKINSGRCIISSCLRSYRNSSKEFPVRLFSFPSNNFYFNKWIRNCRLDGNFNRKTTLICDRHFEKKYLGKKKLKGNAVPNLNLGDACLPLFNSISIEHYKIIDNCVPEEEKLSEESVASSIISEELEQSCDENESVDTDKLLNFKDKKKSQSWTDLSTHFCIIDSNTPKEIPEPCANCAKMQENEAYYKKEFQEISANLNKTKQDFDKLKERFNILKRKFLQQNMRRNIQKARTTIKDR